jgi:hypothetical protein
MAQIRALTHIEHVFQTAFITAVTPPTVKLAIVDASPEFDAGNDVQLVPEERGAAANFTAYQAGANPSGSIPMRASYEHIHYPLEWLFGTVTPSGTTAPYTRAYDGFLLTQLTPHWGTLMYGDGLGVYKFTGAVATKLALTQDNRAAPLKVVTTLGGYSITGGGAFASAPALTDDSVTMIQGTHCTVKLDAFGGTMGNTALTATVDSLSMEIDPGVKYSDYIGNLYHGDVYQLPWKVTLKLSCEFNAGMKTFADAWVNTVWQKLVRVKYTTGSTSALKLFQIDFAGTMLKTPKFFSEKDGRLTFDVELTDTYDSVFAHYLKIQTQCALATLT